MKINIKRNPLAIVCYAISIAAILFSLITLYRQYVSVPEEGDYGEVSLLYIQTAHSGTLSAPQSDNTRTLTLNDVSPTTVFFSDRPYRETGHEATQQFIDEWDDGDDSFLNNPPNAALDILGGDSQSVIILELMDPVYDANTRTLQYDVIILEESDTGISQYGDELDFSTLQSFGEVALFIDSTYKNYHCGCEPDLENNCTCEYHYTLGKSATKEFRAYCTANESIPEGIKITGKKKDTTCTGRNFVYGDYATRSCTNWSPSHTDGVDITVTCIYSK